MAKNDSVMKTAEELATKQREISVAEFFEKNRHLLGFDNASKALLTVVKEAVDNSLDACEEARILPDVKISIQEPREVFIIKSIDNGEIGRILKERNDVALTMGDDKIKFIEKKEPKKGEFVYIFKDKEENEYKFKIYETEKEDKEEGKIIVEQYEFVRGRTEMKISKQASDRFLVSVEDNGPGIVKEQIPRIFGKLLYGSKFGSGKQSRGAQGIGISAALLYAQLTTGKPARVWSKTSAGKPAHYFELRIDTTRNEPIILVDRIYDRLQGMDVLKDHGVKVDFEIEGKYVQSRTGVEEYLRQTAAVNPFARIIFENPHGDVIEFPRVVKELPRPPKAIKPHPHGVEMGMLERMLKFTDGRTVEGFLSKEFSRVSPQVAEEVRKLAGVRPGIKPKELDHTQIEKVWRAMQSYQFMKPPTDCLSPITENVFIAGVKKEYEPDFLAAVTRPPAVYRGNPFQIEVVIGYGGKLEQQGPAKIMRFANRVPLLYQARACATSKSVVKVDWRKYSMEQQNGVPQGPVVIAIHMASVWIPYVSEAKEAIDPYPAIMKEMRLALQEAGRRLQRFISGKRRREDAAQRLSLFERYIPEAAESLSKLSEVPKQKIISELEKMLKKGDVIKQAEAATDAEEKKEKKVDENG